MLTHLRNFIEQYGKPKYSVKENETEFKNTLFRDFMKYF